MIVNETVLNSVLKSNTLITYLKQKQYNEATLGDYIHQELLKKKQMIGYDFVFVDPFISEKAVGINVIFGSCLSYYNKIINKGFEVVKQVSNFNAGKLNTQLLNVIENKNAIPEKLPGTNNSLPNEFFNSVIPKRVFYYTQFKIHFSFENNQIMIKKFNLNRLS